MISLPPLFGRFPQALFVGTFLAFLGSTPAQAGEPIPPQLDDLVLSSGSGLVGFRSLDLQPPFDPSVLNYTATMPFEHTQVQVETVAPSFGYTVNIVEPESYPADDSATIFFNVLVDDPFNPFPSIEETYTVEVFREAPNDLAALSSMVVSGTALNPSFDKFEFSYSAEVGLSTNAITITPTAVQTEATITVKGVPVESGQDSQSIPLLIGFNTIDVVVTLDIPDEDLFVRKGYRLVVRRLNEELLQDLDNDGMEDGWENANGLIVGVDDRLLDKDGDGLANVFEYAFGSDPCDRNDAARPVVSEAPSGFAQISFVQAITDGTLSYVPEVTGSSNYPFWTTDLTDKTSVETPFQQLWEDNAGGAASPPTDRLLRIRLISNL